MTLLFNSLVSICFWPKQIVSIKHQDISSKMTDSACVLWRDNIEVERQLLMCKQDKKTLPGHMLLSILPQRIEYQSLSKYSLSKYSEIIYWKKLMREIQFFMFVLVVSYLILEVKSDERSTQDFFTLHKKHLFNSVVAQGFWCSQADNSLASSSIMLVCYYYIKDKRKFLTCK